MTECVMLETLIKMHFSQFFCPKCISAETYLHSNGDKT